jgi:hypothetical protein
MSRFTDTLSRVRVAAPCEADWDEMRGDERVRFCQHCSLNVYNLSALTRREATRLVTRNEGAGLCVRFYRRKDGTMLTQPCPVGLRALKRRVSKISSAVFAAFIGFLSGVSVAPSTKKNEPVMSGEAVVTHEEIVAGEEANQEAVMMGSMREMISPTGEQYATGAGLGFVLFLVGYPLFKLRERSESKRREELRIWRNS